MSDKELVKVVAWYIFFCSPWYFRVFAWTLTIFVWGVFFVNLWAWLVN